MGFLSVRHNSFSTKGCPWIERVVSGLVTGEACPVCGVRPLIASGDIDVTLERRKGSMWSDVLGCGSYPFFIVSERVVEAWKEEGIGIFPHHRVNILPPYPDKLGALPAHRYFWLDGSKMRGARLDFDASGFVDVRFCPKCGNRTDDVRATYDRRSSGRSPYIFIPGTWQGEKVFTTDLSPTAFFCTEEVMQNAVRHGFSNFRFAPVEDGKSTGIR